MDSIEDKLDLVVEKQDFIEQTYNNITELIDILKNAHTTISSLSVSKMEVDENVSVSSPNNVLSSEISRLHTQIQTLDIPKQFQAGQVAFHVALNKLQKQATKEFPLQNSSKLSCHAQISPEVVHRLIADHLLRSGHQKLALSVLDTCNLIDPESSLSLLPPVTLKQFSILKYLVDELRSKNVTPALEWVRETKSLDPRLSFQLRFQLHKLHYCHLMKLSKGNEALEYARNHFIEFEKDFRQEIYKLIGALAFLQNIEQSAYKSFVVGNHILNQTIDGLTRAFARSIGLSTESHLFTLLYASCFAIPKLLKAGSFIAQSAPENALTSSLGHPALASSSIMTAATNQRDNHDLSSSMPSLRRSCPASSVSAVSAVQKEAQRQQWGILDKPEKLSFAIPLPKRFAYHSLFCCPVSKELSSPNNPPCLLPCGHVLSKETVQSLSRGRLPLRGAPVEPQRFKCPYCPEKLFATDVLEINFG